MFAVPPHSFVPFRDSVLTCLLSQSLGGNSRTTVLVTTSSDRSDSDETVATLRFGERMALVQNNLSSVSKSIKVQHLARLVVSSL